MPPAPRPDTADGRATALLGPSLHDITAATGDQPHMDDAVGEAAPEAGGRVTWGPQGSPAPASPAGGPSGGAGAPLASEGSNPASENAAPPSEDAPLSDGGPAPAPAMPGEPTAAGPVPAEEAEDSAERRAPRPGEGDRALAVPGEPSSEPGAQAQPAKRTGLPQRVGWLLLFCSIPVLFVALQLVGMLLAASLGGLALAAGARDAASYLLDSTSIALFSGQLLCIAVALPWWRYIEHRHRSGAPRLRVTRANAAGILALGLGFQLVLSVALTVVLPLMPDLMENYEASVSAGDLSDWALVPVLATAIGAPLSEEVFCRGLALTFAEKATGRFWAANVLQALMFGLLHGNLVQGTYAFFTALMLGLVYRRYGRVAPCVGLHLALNASSYLVSVLPLSLAGIAALGVLLAGVGWLAADLPAPAWPRRTSSKGR